jgi:hypothetical protein
MRPLRDELQQLVASYGLDEVKLALVPSVHDWLVARGTRCDSPFRQASFVTLSDKTRWIVLLEEITSHHPGQTTLFRHIEWDDYEWISENLARYARHLVLHEVAHARGIRGEAEADRWTVQELRRLEVE